MMLSKLVFLSALGAVYGQRGRPSAATCDPDCAANEYCFTAQTGGGGGGGGGRPGGQANGICVVKPKANEFCKIPPGQNSADPCPTGYACTQSQGDE